MNRALGIVSLTIGVAWVLGGAGSVISSFEMSGQLAEMKAEEIAALNERTTKAVERLEQRRGETEEKEDVRVDKAAKEVDESRAALEEIAMPLRTTVEEKQASVDEALEAGNKRALRRAETAHSRAMKRLEAAVKRPTAKVKRAEELHDAAKARRDERLGAIAQEIAAVKSQQETEVKGMIEAAATQEGPSVLKPILGAALGVLLLGFGLVLIAMKKRGPMVVAEEQVRARPVARAVSSSPIILGPNAGEAESLTTFPMSTEVVRASSSGIVQSESPTIGTQIEPTQTEITTPEDPAVPTPRLVSGP